MRVGSTAFTLDPRLQEYPFNSDDTPLHSDFGYKLINIGFPDIPIT